MSLTVVGLCLAVIVCLYFYNNPLKHSRWYVTRRFINWFPLGMTYAFLYMGRYNLTVAKNALGSLMTNKDFGWIFGLGTLVYGVSFLVNGPLVDKIGGKKGIIIAALGASAANIVLGVLTYLAVTGQLTGTMRLTFGIVYALNMYFQSYGAVSIIKVKAYWFHVRERGVFGAIFGTLISFGVYFAFDWGSAIIAASKLQPEHENLGHKLIQAVFAVNTQPVDATWAVFFIPAAILVFWAVMDWWLIKDTPEEANFPHFDTHDASSGEMHVELSTMDLLKKVFASRLMLLIAFIGLTVGVLRNGTMVWYSLFANQVKQTGAENIIKNWGLLVCLFGIVGGFAGGMLSDKVFRSRRGPPAVIFSALMFVLTILMSVYLFSSPLVLGWSALLITMAVIGVHSLMSGTAATDFGGRKATATCSGIVDGFVYLGVALQSICAGQLTPPTTEGTAGTGLVTTFSLGVLAGRTWFWWPIFLAPFALAGCVLALMIWHELPSATRKYIAEVEDKKNGEIELIPK
jgi:OPA family glycerol-3-phosphate transporter-like MFS transporter